MKSLIFLPLIAFSIHAHASSVGCADEAIAIAKTVVAMNAKRQNQKFSVNTTMIGGSLGYYEGGSIAVMATIGSSEVLVEAEFDNGDRCLLTSVKIN